MRPQCAFAFPALCNALKLATQRSPSRGHPGRPSPIRLAAALNRHARLKSGFRLARFPPIAYDASPEKRRPNGRERRLNFALIRGFPSTTIPIKVELDGRESIRALRAFAISSSKTHPSYIKQRSVSPSIPVSSSQIMRSLESPIAVSIAGGIPYILGTLRRR